MIIFSGHNLKLPLQEVVPKELVDAQIGFLSTYPRTISRHISGIFSIDNGRYGVWRNGNEWDGVKFLKMLEHMLAHNLKPHWVVVPDVPGDAIATNEEWFRWQPLIKSCGFNCALAVQNGHTPWNIPQNADVIFVGGTTEWKHQNIGTFCKDFPRVHVARINSLRWLWVCYYAGAESVDGNGWFRTKPGSSANGKSCFQDLIDFIEISNGIKPCEEGLLFDTGKHTSLMQTNKIP
jgi:hypothetical protein